MFNTFMLTIFNEADVNCKVEVANFCAVIDTLIDQDAGSKLLCSDGHLGRSRWRQQTFVLYLDTLVDQEEGH